MYLTDLADALRSVGLKVNEVSGWKQAGRGPMIAAGGIIAHHTAGPTGSDHGSLGVVINGRSGLAGPLANLHLERDGVWNVVAAGKANHAGVVISPRYDSWHCIGIEAENDGIPPLDWPPVQMDSYSLGCAALAIHYKFDYSMVRGHKEVAAPLGRKPDPDFDMSTFRAMVKADIAKIKGGAPKPPKPPTGIAVISRYLRVTDPFMTGSDVKAVQKALPMNAEDHDGVFGYQTRAHVMSFQGAHRLPKDGIVGPNTTKALGLVWGGK